MDSNTFMGWLIAALITLLGGASIIVALIVRPVININKEITELRKSTEVLNGSLIKIEQRLEKHGKEIDTIDVELRKYEGRISKMEGKMR